MTVKPHLIITLLLFSCNGGTSEQFQSEHENTLKPQELSETEPNSQLTLVNLSQTNLRRTFFVVGDAIHFTDSCAFLFECDCCRGELVFNEDSTFYCTNYCMSDVELLFGAFQVRNNILLLSFNGVQVVKSYNYENELDPSVIDFIFKDTVIEAFVLEYKAEECNGKLKLTEIENREIAIETEVDYEEVLKNLVDEGLLPKK